MRTSVTVFQYYDKVKDPTTGTMKKVLRSPSWYVRWQDPITGKRRVEACGTRKRDAERRAREIEGQIAAGVYRSERVVTWQEFRARFEQEVLTLHSEGHQEQMRISMNMFEKHCKPRLLSGITTAAIDRFKARRSADTWRGGPIVLRTVNRDLGNIRVALRRAKKWKLLAELPEFEMCRLPEKRPAYVPIEKFQTIFNACPDDFWRGVVATAYLAGLRRGEILSLRWSDLDLDANPPTMTIRAEVAKARRTDTIPIVSELADLLRNMRLPALQVFDGRKQERPSPRSKHTVVLPWPRSLRTLHTQWHRVQDSAGLAREEHVTLHDLRRSFRTNFAKYVEAAVLQRLMRHRDIDTTVRHYVDGGQHMASAIAMLPRMLPQSAGTGTA